MFKADWFYWNSSIVNTIHYNISYFSTKKLIHLSEYLCTGNDSNLLIVFYVQIMPDDFVMQLHRF
ncbi:hypothetical protein BB542_18620 [Escherichia coli]|nr:hypothetical protein BB541_05300 [Escherichia coli]PBU52163.1 hypothetical protein BB542_18620 [Escherichia coli]PBU96085.1 hypothetical protein BB550_05300 [Escherichia coli]